MSHVFDLLSHSMRLALLAALLLAGLTSTEARIQCW